MSAFVQVKNGFVNGSVRDADIYAAKENIRAFLNTSAQDYKMKTSPLIYQEILRAGRVLIGEDFRNFLVANYKNGLGPCASIVSAILLYLSGKTSARAIIGDIRRAEDIVHYNNNTPGAWDDRVVNHSNNTKQAPVMLDNVVNFDYYRLLRAIGVENFSRLMLVLLGETRYD